MKTHAFLISASILTALALPAGAGDCHAQAAFKDVAKEPGGGPEPGAGKTVRSVPRAPQVFDIHWDVDVSGCPASAGRPNKFAKASYGTITYKLKKRYVKTGAEAEQEKTENWSDDDKALALTSKVEGKDPQGYFEVTGAEVVRTVCGCR